MLALLLALQVATAPGSTYSGIAKQLDVRIPRIETTVKIDGVLDEPAWSRAALLTGFSQYRPVEDRKSTRLNSSHSQISYAVFCLKKKKRHKTYKTTHTRNKQFTC